MAFDVAGARKAGYSDAEIAQFMAQSASFDAAAAKKAGYSDGEIIAHLSSSPMRTGAAAVPTAQEVATGRYTPPPQPPAQPEPTLVDRAIGTGEAALTVATGATGGSIGMIGGTLKGLAEQILAGKFGTPEAAKMVEQSAAQGAQALTYAPRTEQGQEQAAAVGQAFQQIVPVAGLTGEMQAIANAVPRAPARVVAQAGTEGVVRSVAGDAAAAGVGRGIDAAARVADLAGKNISTLPRRALERLRNNEPAPTPGTMGSAGAAGTDMAVQRRALASDLPRPIQLTKGQATRDPAQLKFEVETAKLQDAGAPLRERYVRQNEQILQNFDAWIDQTGGEAPTLRAVGESVDRALVKQAATDKAAIRAAYKAAEQAGELEAPVTLSSVVSHINESMPDAEIAPIISAARRRALRYGVAVEGADGELIPQAVPLRVVERYRQNINDALDYQPQNIRQATIMKGMIDEATDGLGGNLYRDARSLRARYAQNYENRATIAQLLDRKRGLADRRVAFEDVFDQTILKGSLDDVRNVRRVLQRSGSDGAQAWRDLQGQTATWIRDQAAKNSATDSLGNRVVSVDGLDKAIRTLDADGRLDFIFGKKGAQQMRDIRDLAQIAKTVPPEAAVNTSNTATTLLAGFVDVGTSGATGLPLPIATMVRVVRQHVKDSALRRRIEDALRDMDKRQAPGKSRPPVSEPASQTIH